MLNFSMVVSGSAAVTYLLDTHRANALHILALSNFGKNMVLYASTFFANGIILSHGVKVSLLILGGCQAVCWAASVPMYVFGKRVRSFVSVPRSRSVLEVPADHVADCSSSSAISGRTPGVRFSPELLRHVKPNGSCCTQRVAAYDLKHPVQGAVGWLVCSDIASIPTPEPFVSRL